MVPWASALEAASSPATTRWADPSTPAPIRSAPLLRNAWPAELSGALQRTGGRVPRIHIFPPALQLRVRARAEKSCYHRSQINLRRLHPRDRWVVSVKL